ncbi:hypothetical protein [Ilumatobacter nonamiensis]|uniref:hypothetical protein n=1 Tax=Ilumatobacter nonamiensis TaxID=467093 RepID=UPI0011D27B28|nr:hypothetical protein [Ilumatobacter nonamiensis]
MPNDTGAAPDSSAEPSTAAQAYIDGVLADLTDDPAFPIADDEAECMARAAVESVGVDELESADVSPDDFARVGALTLLPIDLAPDFTEQLATQFGECADFGAVVVAGVAADLNVEAGSLDCMADEIDRDRFNLLLADALVTGGETDAAGEAFGEELALGLSGECSKDFFLAVGVGDGAIDEAQRSCLEEELDPAVAKQLIGAQAEGPAAAEAAVEAARPALVACDVNVVG